MTKPREEEGTEGDPFPGHKVDSGFFVQRPWHETSKDLPRLPPPPGGAPTPRSSWRPHDLTEMEEAFGGTEAAPPPGGRGLPVTPPSPTEGGLFPSGPPAAPIVPGDVLSDPVAGELVVERVLGRGGMGVVYLARQRGFDRPVAVKTLHDDLRTGPSVERFALEARIMGRLEHPNIVPVHVFGCDPRGRPFLGMKVIRGLEWAKLIAPKTDAERRRAEKLDLRAHLKIMIRVCDAIAFAHSKGVIHRDLKPANVMIGAFGEVLVTDWGIALTLDTRESPSRSSSDGGSIAAARAAIDAAKAGRGAAPPPPAKPARDPALSATFQIPASAVRMPAPDPAPAAGSGSFPALSATRKAQLVGTPAYLPPEMAVGDEVLCGPWTDVFLLGGILFRLLYGRPPYMGANLEEIVQAAQRCAVDVPAVRGDGALIPPELVEIVKKALRREPGDRWASAEALRDAVADWLVNEASVTLASQALARLDDVERASRSGESSPSGIYASYTQSIAELSQSLEFWRENRSAAAGRVRARLACAAFSIEQGDLASAEAQLDRLDEERPLDEDSYVPVAGSGARAMPRSRDPGAGLAPVLSDRPGQEEAVRRADLRELVRRRRMERLASARRKRVLVASLIALAVVACIAGFLALRERGRVRSVEEANERRRRAVAAVEAATWRDPAERVRLYQQAIEIDPSWNEAYMGLSGAFDDWAYEKAVAEPLEGARLLANGAKAVEPILAREPDNAAALYYRGYALEMNGRPEEALADYRRALALSPEGHDGLAAASSIALSEGRFEDAERLATQAIDVAGDEDDLTRRSIARYVQGDVAGALADVERLERAHPAAPEYYGYAALYLLAQGERIAAAEKLIEALRRHPSSPQALPLLAWLAAKRGDREQALGLERRAKAAFDAQRHCYLALEPMNVALAAAPPPRREGGLAFVLRLDLASVMPREPAEGPRRRAEGEAALARGDAAAALAGARRALAYDPSDGAARLLHARALERLGRKEAAADERALVPLLAPDLADEAVSGR